MDSFFETLSYGSAALFALAVGVALWEHWRRQARTADLQPLAPPAGPAQVDFDLSLLDASLAASENKQRKATVQATKGRVARPATAGPAKTWIETRPMVAPGIGAEPQTQ